MGELLKSRLTRRNSKSGAAIAWVLLLFFAGRSQAGPEIADQAVKDALYACFSTQMFHLQYGSRRQENPSILRSSKLVPGDTLYLRRSTLYWHLSGAQRDRIPRTLETLEMHVLKIEERGEKRYCTLDSPLTGPVEMNLTALGDKIYSRPDFALWAPFEEGDYVRIGDGSLNTETLISPNGYPDNVTLTNGRFPYIGRFIRVFDERSYLIEVTKRNRDGTTKTVQVKAGQEDVLGLRSGNAKNAQARLLDFMDFMPVFSRDEEVRYRDPSGLMRQGRFMRADSYGMSIRDTAGQDRVVDSKSVFKIAGTNAPWTPQFVTEFKAATAVEIAKFPNPDGLVAEFLNGAGRLTSHPGFSFESPKDQLKALMNYENAVLASNMSASYAEEAGLDTFEHLVCAGAGVCRHQAVLLGTALAEAGISTRMVYFGPKVGYGHAWLEVDMPDAAGRVTTFIVDPTKNVIETLEQARQKAQSSVDSDEAKWFLTPGRKRVLPEIRK